MNYGEMKLAKFITNVLADITKKTDVQTTVEFNEIFLDVTSTYEYDEYKNELNAITEKLSQMGFKSTHISQQTNTYKNKTFNTSILSLEVI